VATIAAARNLSRWWQAHPTLSNADQLAAGYQPSDYRDDDTAKLAERLADLDQYVRRYDAASRGELSNAGQACN
jgi:hypothetical protein